jgi:uncharacterized protein YdhG (YjbR/CyaY superfamily)
VPGKATTIDGYLAGVDAEKRAALQALRRVIRAALPGAEEGISYGIAAFRRDGKPVVGFGATARHCALFLMSGRTVADHAAELAGYDTSKGTIRFQPDDPLPAALVRKLVKARLAENAEAAGGRKAGKPRPAAARGQAARTRKRR